MELSKEEETAPIARERAPFPGGSARIGIYTAMGALSGVIALPFIPDNVAKRVRGALAQDLCNRAGITLTPEARALLAEPEGELLGGTLGIAARFVASRWLRRFAWPLGFVAPVRSAVTTFALGHLLNRYLTRVRATRTTRMDAEEAKRVRGIIDRTIVETMRTDLVVPREGLGSAPEDLRDAVTQVIDGVVITIASVPDFLTRRLDAAFDSVIKREGS